VPHLRLRCQVDDDIDLVAHEDSTHRRRVFHHTVYLDDALVIPTPVELGTGIFVTGQGDHIDRGRQQSMNEA
jgi:hypothetical protein